MEGYCHRGWQCPGCCGPDDRGNLFSCQSGIDLCRVVEQRVFHPDRGAGVILIFDFRFRKCGFVMHTPVDGSKTLVDESIFVERVEGREHDRLVLRVPGFVSMVAASESADPLEWSALQIEIFLSALAAGF